MSVAAVRSRRLQLTSILAVTIAALVAGCTSAPPAVRMPSSGPVAAYTAPPEASSSGGSLAVTLTAAESTVPYAGRTRWAMTYNGQVAGPTLRVHPGDRLTITLVNQLSEPTSLHTHGLHVSPSQDNPFVMVEPGESRTFTYDIPRDHQAGTYWYHPHVHGITAEQVASGLSGAILVEDSTDIGLSQVSTDRVLVINDPPLVDANPWSRGGMMGGGGGGAMMTGMVGRTGPRLLTNGSDGVALTAAGGRLERAHIVNATASTRLRLTFNGAAMLRLSAVGGRLPAAEPTNAIELSPGERTEVVLVPDGDGGTLSAQRLSNPAQGRAASSIIATVAPDAGSQVSALPTSMRADKRDLFAPGVRVSRQRVVSLDGHMNPTIDGTPFDPNRVNLTAASGTVEEWLIESTSPMDHPIHLHTWPFQIKNHAGWTDIVTVPAFGTQVIRVEFADFSGTTVLHCHILDHEDTGMMAVISVE